ncbi:MAG: sugar kinase [Liquorilactobacillus ghanensis]|uniref:sugar kinase n=1 Tax=Liquorilactobacillus ghanensis TaxID=399370 RepID=UPI0039EA9AA2
MVDLLTVGEPLVVFASTEDNQNLVKAANFQKHLAGAELNVAVGISKLGFSTEYISRVGNDPFGIFIKERLIQAKIGTTYLSTSQRAWTGFELKEKVTQGDPDTFYFRKNSAVTELTRKIATIINFQNVRVLHLTGIFAALSEQTLAISEALIKQAKKDNTTVVFDPNLRPALWSSTAKMVAVLNRLAFQADIVLPGINEGRILTGLDTPEQIADFYLQHGSKNAVIKVGARGSYFKTDQAKTGFVPGFKVKRVIDTVGAGDGFATGVISGLLDEIPLPEAITRGNAIGALATQTTGDNDNYPDRLALKKFIAENSKK